MPKFVLAVLLGLSLAAAFQTQGWCESNCKTLPIGFNLPLTGSNPDLGTSSKNAAELYLMKHQTIKVGGQCYALKFVYADNAYTPAAALKANTMLIEKEKVLGIIGPQASSQAVPAGEVAQTLKTPMLSPWSTNVKTTFNRPYVFRGCFLDSFQAPVLTVFAADKLGARTAAVLYDRKADYSRGLAEYFKMAFEKLLGKGTVVAFESFETGDKDFSSQMVKIITSKADVLFVPQYYTEVPLIVKTAKAMGWKKPILGSDSWGSGDLMSRCGNACKGYYFVTHYAAIGARGATKVFVNEYQAAFDKIPDDAAALTWDAVGMMIQAIKQSRGFSGNLKADRSKIKYALGRIKNYPGVTGRISFTPEGDPRKCAVVVKINDRGQFEFYHNICPR